MFRQPEVSHQSDVTRPEMTRQPQPIRQRQVGPQPVSAPQATEVLLTSEPTGRTLMLRQLGVAAAVLVAGVVLVLATGLVAPPSFASQGSGPAAASVDPNPPAAPTQGDTVLSDTGGGDSDGAGLADGVAVAVEPPPLAAQDRFVVEVGRTELNVLANDTIYGDVELTILEPPADGRLLGGGGRVVFDSEGFIGDAVFTYRICSAIGCDGATVAVASIPKDVSRLVPQAPERVLDTRTGEAPPPGERQSIVLNPSSDVTAVALAVTVAGTDQAGEVVVDGGAGPVAALRVGGQGAMTTNTIVLQMGADDIAVTSTAGGHLVVDVVGTFVRSGATTAGRFVPTTGVTLGQLVTSEEGRTATFALDPAAADGDATAILALVTADVGDDGGIIRIGQEQGAFDQMLMWGPPTSDDRLRQGLVMVVPGAENQVALRYDGGSVLTVEAVGYFTAEGAEPGRDGLLLATEPTVLFDGTIAAGESVTVDDPTGFASDLFVIERSSGRSVSTVLPAVDGQLQLGADTDRPVTLDLLAVFL